MSFFLSFLGRLAVGPEAVVESNELALAGGPTEEADATITKSGDGGEGGAGVGGNGGWPGSAGGAGGAIGPAFADGAGGPGGATPALDEELAGSGGGIRSRPLGSSSLPSNVSGSRGRIAPPPASNTTSCTTLCK